MKKNNGFNLIEMIIIMIVTSVIASITTGIIMLNSSVTTSKEVANDKDLQEFIGVYDTLLSKYYDNNIDKKGMLSAAEEAMVNFLGDKYTTYLEDDEYQEILDDLSENYNGIGIAIIDNQIVKVTANSPASEVGLLTGDIIIEVNGINVEEKDSSEIKSLISNDDIKNINLIIKRGEELLTFNMEKRTLLNTAVTYDLIENTNIGYIYIQKFSENLDNQVSNALKELENKGATSLIIDVRDNVGGYLSSAKSVSSLFLEEGKVIYSLEANNKKVPYKDETKEKRNMKIVVLINGNTASAAEILAAALKDSYNATLVGTKSYGKGKVQQVASLTSGDSVKYTSAKWLTPNGICIDGVGITPDYTIENSEIEDLQLEKAIELLN